MTYFVFWLRSRGENKKTKQEAEELYVGVFPFRGCLFTALGSHALEVRFEGI